MLLDVKHVTKTFGGLVAVSALSLSVEAGEVIGLIGPNGSGKTTSFNLISGFLTPDSGVIEFDGRPITGLKPHQVCQGGLARTFQLTKPFAELTAAQNVMVGSLYGDTGGQTKRQAQKESEKILDFVGLGGRGDAPAASFGVVGRKRIEIARALATKPKMLLLDEMMSGLTPTEMAEALALVKSIRDSGVTLIVVEHVMKAILEISDRLLVLHHGEKIAQGIPAEVMNDKTVIEAYIGE